MTIEEITKKFIDNPNRMRPGATSLAKRFKCTKETIYEARKEARKIIRGGTKKVELKITEDKVRTFWQKLGSLLSLGDWK